MAGAEQWTKMELALWLLGPYASATRHVIHGERPHVVAPDAEVDLVALDELLLTTRRNLFAELEHASHAEEMVEVGRRLFERGLLHMATDGWEREVVVPVDRARVRLEDRVRSLFVADYLNEPLAYAGAVACRACGDIVVGEDHACGDASIVTVTGTIAVVEPTIRRAS